MQDTDGSGAIDAEELAVVFEKLGEPVSGERVTEMIDEVDADHTGEIEFVEFLDLMSRFKKGESKFASLGKLSSVCGPWAEGYDRGRKGGWEGSNTATLKSSALWALTMLLLNHCTTLHRMLTLSGNWGNSSDDAKEVSTAGNKYSQRRKTSEIDTTSTRNREARKRSLEISFQLDEVRAATSSHTQHYVLSCVLKGNWVEVKNGRPVKTFGEKRFQGIGKSTRDARQKATLTALTKLRKRMFEE